MKEFIAKYQKAIVGTGAVSVLLICYLQQKELSKLRSEVNKIPAPTTIDSLATENFILKTQNGRYELSLEHLYEVNPTAAKQFDEYLKTKIPMTSIILKNKNMNSAFEIKGLKWKYIKTEEEPILELSLVNEMSNNKIKKKIKSPEVYFNEKLDKKIIEDYNTSNQDIITIANKYNVKTFEIVSLLVRYKIISKRSESRGYDKYKDSEEYKSKLNI